MIERTIREYRENVFDAIGSQWMLITAGNDEKINTMTASWGGMGVLWKRNVATVYVRPQRYTKQFIDASDHFSLCFFDESWRRQLAYLGSVSGRDEPKIETAGLTIVSERAAPYFAQARLVMICRKLYAQPMEESCFLDPTVLNECYPLRDLHTMYIGEITQLLTQE